MSDTPLHQDSGEEIQGATVATEDATLLSGRYRLEAPLGEGGMGQVYLAEHVLMKKKVAIKVLHGELTQNPEIVARFQREAQAAASLDSPHVCKATDFGQTDDGAFFLVMEHLEGETLQRVMTTFGQLPVERALHIARQIASALSEAHSRGIVHRDLKPENVMLVDRDGDPDTVKIMDFGIARMMANVEDGDDEEPAARLTRQGMVYGTPHYMSPEQVAGDDVDAGTDIYALGVVLFEMLTGEPPYDGDNIARIMGQHVTSPIPVLAERCPEKQFPEDLQELLNKLMAKSVADRPASATQVIALFDDLDLSPPKAGLKAPDMESVASAATMSVRAISRGAHSTGEVATGTLERLVGMIFAAFEKGWSFWTTLGKRERMLGAVAALGAVAVLAVVVVLAVLLMSDERQAQAIEDHRQALLEDAEVVEALDAARRGDRASLNQLLESHGAHLRYVALMADIEEGRATDRLGEARMIIDLDGRYAHDAALIDLVVSRLHTDSDGEEARALLSENWTPTVRSALSEIARTHSSRARRNMAFEFLEEHGQVRRLDRWDRVSVELRQTSGCEALREKIEELVSIGDPRAVSTLEALNATRRTGCGTLNLSDCIGCIRGDLRDAIDALGSD